ncbi:MAG: redoxin domain-containing protein, partial [Phycisphaerae bacterium]|nr:redoxin domain-containing protein [Phycisphaerae bacterium]
MLSRYITTAAVALCVAGVAVAGPDDAPKLTIGDKAPPIDITHWVKGIEVENRKAKTITSFEKDKVYVLEFWATWCGPCIYNMPHLSKLQEKYKDYDVTIIGVSDEVLPTVVSFLFKTSRSDGK